MEKLVKRIEELEALLTAALGRMVALEALAGTTRRRGVDLLDWPTEAIQAELDGVPPPALT
jgi:hypothetical protein